MRSMTGFGVGEAPLAAEGKTSPTGKLMVEIRAVNHRYLDVRVRAPNQLPDLASTVEAIARERLTRGRFDVTVRLEGAALGAVTLHQERARSVFAALVALRDELAPGVDVPLSLLGSVPDLLVPSIEQAGDEVRAALSAAFDAATVSLDAMRLREGLALGDDIVRRLVTVRKLAGAVTEVLVDWVAQPEPRPHTGPIVDTLVQLFVAVVTSSEALGSPRSRTDQA